jgi:hypothetical protein
VQLPANACGKGIWERRMRETRMSGVTRGERLAGQGMRLMRHARGNPDTDYAEAYTLSIRSSTLPVY